MMFLLISLAVPKRGALMGMVLIVAMKFVLPMVALMKMVQVVLMRDIIPITAPFTTTNTLVFKMQ